MIIGFTGRAGCGKDTACAYLIKQYEFERKAFADPLKESIAAFLNIPVWEVNKHKLDETVHVAIGYKNEPTDYGFRDDDGIWHGKGDAVAPDHMWSPISEMTFREALQRYGTESHRDVFGNGFWVDMTLPVNGFYSGRKIVVTDCRFQNEVDRINELGGIVCRIIRPGVEPVSTLHSSEHVDLLNGISYEIGNDTTVEDFYAELDKMLDFITNSTLF